MTSTDERELALFQARLTAALALASNARRAIGGADAAGRGSLAPYLDQCASELERAAGRLRAVADEAVDPGAEATCAP